MRKTISFMHISIDGFVAGPNGEMNWIKVMSRFAPLNEQSKMNYLPTYNKHHQLWKFITMHTPQEKNGHIISGSS